MSMPTPAEIEAYSEAALAMLNKHGAVATPRALRDFRLETSAGPLHVSILTGWLACVFEDVEAARPVVNSDRLNPHSGKWNWMAGIDELPAFEFELNRLCNNVQTVAQPA